MYHLLLSLLCIVLTGLFARSACAESGPAQYVAAVWQTEQGLPQNSVSAIAQDHDGYLWLATNGGLARFDGVRFRVFGTDDIPGLKSTGFRALYVSGGGDLWIGAMSGLINLHDGVFTKPNGNAATSIRVDRRGKIWINTLQGVACCAAEEIRSITSYRGKPVREFLLESRDGGMWFRCENEVVRFGIDGSEASVAQGTMAGEARDGSVWVASPSRLMRYQRGSFSEARLPTDSSSQWSGTVPWQGQLGRAAAPQAVLAMATDTDGELLLLTPSGLVRPTDGQLGRPEPLPAPSSVGGEIKVQTLFVDRTGNRWVGTLGRGLFRFRRAPLTAYDKENGLSDSPYRAVFEDREGRVWLGGDDSVSWFDGRQFHPLPGLAEINSIAQTPDGDVWFGGSGALHRWHMGVLTQYPLDTPEVSQLLVDREGTLWVTAASRTQSRDLFRLRDGSFEKVDSNVLALAEDPDGGLWLALWRPARIRHVRAGKSVEYSGAQGVPQTGVLALLPDSTGALWFATASGLHRLRDGKFASITSRNGLTTDINAILLDDQNILWLPSNQGIFRIPLKEANDLADGRLATIPPAAYGLAEGMRIGECNAGALKTRDGRLWFSTMRGVVAIDPKAIGPPPPVVVEEAWAGRTALPWNSHALAAAGNDTFEFRFTALDLSAPERQRFRYRLDPYDKDWVEAGVLRTARYNNMRPGEYSFHVIAANSFGVWNERGAKVSFGLRPRYYESTWFRVLCVSALASLLWLAYQLRIRQLQRVFNSRLDERVQERTRIARELHDTLLQTSTASLLHMQSAYGLLTRGREGAAETLKLAMDIARDGIAQGREAIQDMRLSTVTKNDLARELRIAGEQMAAQGSAAFHVTVEGSPRDLHPILRDEIHKIALEAMRNAFKHSEAHSIQAEIFYGHELRVRIRDDGKGMDPVIASHGRSEHYGVPGMRERAVRIGAKFDIRSSPGAGTEIQLSVPGAIAFGRVGAASLFRRLRRNH